MFGRPAVARQPSDESCDSGEGADGWFDQANKRPGGSLGFLGMQDDEPPYFLPHDSSNNSNNASMDRPRLHNSQITSQPKQAQHSVSGGSSAGDYRSVIDDLTVENRKLKQQLRKLTKSKETHLEKDKLFEVKIHATLSARKRRQLEDVLESFASSIDEPMERTASKSKQSNVTHSRSSLDHTKKSAAKKSPSSNTSTSRVPDSAYASMSISGPTSLFTPTNIHGPEGRKPSQPVIKTDQNIRSFLHNIPEGLLPKHSPVITERQKKKLVVQRLEELFTGSKGLIVGVDSQPLQQQEVSASAAKADEAAHDGGVSHREGHREAHMLPYVMDVDSGKPKDLAQPPGNGHLMDAYGSDASNEASPSHSDPGQRPTRPLDLDPDRAQIPSENVEYIRHLGLSTPKFSSYTSSDSATAADADGWIYLNLLVSMAQLHIINVTPAFVREALLDVSERFQVSQDGKKVRWRGGTEGTRLSSDDDGNTAANQTPEDSDSLDEPNRKRRKVDARKFAPVPVDAPDAKLNHYKPVQSFHYKPLFNHAESPGGFISSDESDSLFGYKAGNDGHQVRAFADPQIRRGLLNQRSAKEKQDAGLLVYYNGAKFCTDLSGDHIPELTPLPVSAADEDGYFNGERGALGDSSQKNPPMFERTPSGSLLPFRPFKDYSKGASIPGIEDTRPTTPDVLGDQEDNDLFVDLSASGTSLPNHQQAFESTGLGGTRPADHFIMKVETRQTVRDDYHPDHLSRLSESSSGQKKFAHTIPISSLESFFKPSLEANKARTTSVASAMENLPVRTQILSSQIRQLEPSELPPPLGYHTGYSSSDEESDCSDASSQLSLSPRKKAYPQISYTSPGPLEQPPWAQQYPDGGLSDGDESDNYEEDDGDGSIDMLDEARRLDPDTVAAKEKEFEMCIDDKGTDAATINESIPPSLRGVLRRSTVSDVPTSALSEEDEDEEGDD